METNVFIELLFKNASERKLEYFEIYFMSSKNSSIKVLDQEVESYSDSNSQGISFRVLHNGKMGYSYTESLDENNIDFLIEEALENAAIIENEDVEEIYTGGGDYIEVDRYNPSLENVSIEDKISLLKEIEKKSKENDVRIKKLNQCVFASGSSTRIIKNSKGLDLSDTGNSAYVYASVVSQDKDITKSGSGYRVSNDFNSFSSEDIAREAVEDAISKLDPISIESKDYEVLIKNEAFASMLGAFTGIFSAENVQKGISKLKEKLGTTIANKNITLIDDPHLKNGIASSSFDGEGVPTKYKEVIKNGVLKTYLHNLKTAKKDGVESTGNAAKGGYKGTISISPSNFYLKQGDLCYDKLIKGIHDGILVTSFAGLHSGLNTVSGDFSLAAEGFTIKEGKITDPLKQITVAGNFFDLLLEINEIGDDLKFGLSQVGSPSVLLGKLAITAD
jgi:PmbA protein